MTNRFSVECSLHVISLILFLSFKFLNWTLLNNKIMSGSHYEHCFCGSKFSNYFGQKKYFVKKIKLAKIPKIKVPTWARQQRLHRRELASRPRGFLLLPPIPTFEIRRIRRLLRRTDCWSLGLPVIIFVKSKFIL